MVAKFIYYLMGGGHSLSRENKYIVQDVFGAYKVNFVNFLECASI